MKILLTSYPFHPMIGGVETVSLLLAQEFNRRGLEVKVATMAAARDVDDFPFEVVRRPSPLGLARCVRWCDVVLQNGLSLRLAYPLLAIRRPWIVIHTGMYWPADGPHGWRARVKSWSLRFSHGIFISEAVADHVRCYVGGGTEIIPNPYDDSLFRQTNDGARPVDLVFLGRLVSDKGAHVLLDALGRLKERGLRPQLDIVGGGPEEERLRRVCAELDVTGQVRFMGPMMGDALVGALNQARIMVVPSVWAEPFGIVALEGMACGCVVVGTETGGLKNAIGPGGVTVPNGDAVALTEALAALLAEPAKLGPYRNAAARHLAKHTAGAIADRYLNMLSQICGQ